MNVAVLIAAALALCPEGSPASGDALAAIEVRLSETLADARDRYGFPGATAAIVTSDGALATAAVGLADVEGARPMTARTPMLAASIGKTFVAATVLALENEGVLSRDDLLRDHLGDLAWFGTLPNADTIEIGHLLRHRAGLPDHVHRREFQAALHVFTDDTAFHADRLVAFVSGLDPLFDAGTGYAYSDTGYVLLGLVIEQATGRPWRDVVSERFLAPLELKDTVASDRAEIPGLAVGYTSPDNPFGLSARTADQEGRLLWNPAVESAGGGFASTSADLARWGRALFTGEAMDNAYLDRLLQGAPVTADAPEALYAAGVSIRVETPYGRVWGHGGWVPGFVSSLRHYPDHGVTIAFQINTDVEAEGGRESVVDALEARLAELAIAAARTP